MPQIHPTAIISPQAELADDSIVGAYAIVEGRVRIGPGSVIKSHTLIHGTTFIGAACQIGPSAYVGMDPQHLGYKGEETFLIVGDNVIVREGASIHRAFKPGEENATRVGSRVFMMANSHVAHDCQIDDDVIFAHGALMGGHVRVGSRAFLGGAAVIHQFCRVGRLAIVGGGEGLSRDVPPFAAVRYGGLKGYNAIGCKRSGMSARSLHALRAAFHRIGNNRMMPAAVRAIISDVPDVPEVRELLQFISESKRGIQPALRFAMYDRGSESSSGQD